MTERNIKILPSGDSAVLIRFGSVISEELNREVRKLSAQLTAEKIKGIIELIPSYSDLTLLYNPLIVSFKTIYKTIETMLEETREPEEMHERILEIPVCYEASMGTDLEEVSRHTGLGTEEIIQIHSSATYRVYLLGFTPGFPYLGGMKKQIACPRKSNPRQSIPAGSVGIAGNQTGIYPIDSPGGWQIIGRTPLRLFDPGRKDIFLFRAGDRIRFRPIDKEEFLLLSNRSWGK